MTENPKLKNSNIIDCIPQTKECPLNCAECFYNGGRFYRTIDEPLMPTVEQAKGKIVRVNSGNDSNIHRKQVIEQTKQYPQKFYNTSLPNFDFPAPVVFTCNGHNLILAEKGLENIMYVRVRATIFDLSTIDKAIRHYQIKHKIPVVLTFMHYYHQDLIPEEYRHYFTYKKHVINEYWCHSTEAILAVMARYKSLGVRMCGTPSSSLCVDCRNCELLYLLFNSEKK
jgi:hypothetical protein